MADYTRYLHLQEINRDYDVPEYRVIGIEDIGGLIDLTIPSYCYGHKVTEIGVSAFQNNSMIRTIELPRTIKKISDAAFRKCKNLQTVQFYRNEYEDTSPYSLASIGHQAFRECEKLLSINLDPLPLITIGVGAFYECKKLTSIYIPEGVTSIGNSAFFGCVSLVEVKNASSLTITPKSAENGYAGGYALEVRGGAIDTKIIDYQNFKFYPLKDTYYLIGYFGNYDSGVLQLPNGIKIGDETKYYNINKYAFYFCEQLTKVIIPNYVLDIDSCAFEGCKYITEIEFSENSSVTHFGQWAFKDCSFERFVIPQSVKEISNSVFAGCSKLKYLSIPFIGHHHKNETEEEQAPFGWLFGTKTYTNSTGVTQKYLDTKNPDGTFNTKRVTYYLPNSLEEVEVTGGIISYGAFYQCRMIKSIILSDSVALISDEAFYKCSSLENISLGSNIGRIGDNAFNDCHQLYFITIPASVTHIGEGAFAYTNLQDITFQENSQLISIAAEAFIDCPIKNFNIPQTVTTIGDAAFLGCTDLTSITIPESVQLIGAEAFAYCAKLKKIYFKATISELAPDNGIFYEAGTEDETEDGIENGISVVFGSNVTQIPRNLFYYESIEEGEGFSTAIRRIEFDNNNVCTTIGTQAFWHGAQLEYISLPSSINHLEPGAFRGCSSLKEIVLPFIGGEKTSEASANSLFGYVFGEEEYEGGISASQNYSSTGTKIYYIPEQLSKVTVLGGEVLYGAFCNCVNINTIDVSALSSSIGGKAFYGCKALKDIIYPSNIKEIGEYAFYECEALDHIEVPQDINNIGDNAFQYCGSITSILIPNTITHINQGALTGCGNLTDITIPFIGQSEKGIDEPNQYPLGYIFGTQEYENSIPIQQFYYGQISNELTNSTYYFPKNLKSVTVTGGNILTGAFYNCTGLTTINFPKNISYIGALSFYKCEGLTSISILQDTTFIGEGAFSGCSGLTEISLPFVGRLLETEEAGPTTLFGYIFGTQEYKGSYPIKQYYTDELYEQYYLPNKLETVFILGGEIMDGAFQDCKNIINIVLPDDATKICKNAFKDCSNLKSITIPQNINIIQKDAFYGCNGLKEVRAMGFSNWLNTTYENEFSHPNYYGMLYILKPDGEPETEIIIPENINKIGAYILHNCTIPSITIPSTVLSIEKSAFQNCLKLENLYYDVVQLPDLSNDNKIFDGAGLEGSGITVTFGSNVKRVPKNMFKNINQPKITKVVFNTEQLESIGQDAFKGCNKLKTVNMSNNSFASWFDVDILDGGSPFLPGHADLYIEGVLADKIIFQASKIKDRLFEGCSSFRYISAINNQTGSVSGVRAFAECNKLQTLIYTSSAATIPANMCENCRKLSLLIWHPDTSNTPLIISEKAFSGCKDLRRIVFDKKPDEIQGGAFNLWEI